jgi:hypothetical protein
LGVPRVRRRSPGGDSIAERPAPGVDLILAAVDDQYGAWHAHREHLDHVGGGGVVLKLLHSAAALRPSLLRIVVTGSFMVRWAGLARTMSCSRSGKVCKESASSVLNPNGRAAIQRRGVCDSNLDSSGAIP